MESIAIDAEIKQKMIGHRNWFDSIWNIWRISVDFVMYLKE